MTPPALLMSAALTALALLGPAERAVFKLFESTRGKKASDWAAAHLRLDGGEHAAPGRWDPDLTPYLREPMDAVTRDGVKVVVCLKPSRVGWSLAVRGVMGFLVDCDPGPQMVLQPDLDAVREFFREEVRPMLEGTPALHPYLTGRPADLTSRRARLANCRILGAWATNPNTLKRRTIRYLFAEEPGGYPEVGAEGDVFALALKRLVTFGHRARAFVGGSPTVKAGPLWQAWERCGVRHEWHVPCPHCGAYQVLRLDGLRAPEGATPDEIEAGRLAWYQCAAEACTLRYESLPAMNRRGAWAAEGRAVGRDGRPEGPPPRPCGHLGYKIPGLVSPFYDWHQIAAEDRRSAGDTERRMVFVNTAIGEPFEQTTDQADAEALKRKRDSAGPPGVVPDWCGLLLATADTQKRHFQWLVRAWGPKGRSRLIAYGTAHTFEDLHRWALGSEYLTAEGHPVTARALLIDSGGGRGDYTASRTEQVYQFAAADPDRILPTKGSSDKRPDGRTFWFGKIHRRPGDKPLAGVRRIHFKPDLYKDRLARLIATEPDAPDLWEVHAEIGPDYLRQMTAEHKVIDRKGKVEVWERRTDKAVNDLWDCEVLQTMGADYFQARLIPPDQSVAREAITRRAEERRPRRGGGRDLDTLDRIAARIDRR